MNIDSLIKDIGDHVKKHFDDFIGLYFFGSRSKENGGTNEESDYDFLLIFDHELHWQEKNCLYDLIADIEVQEGIVIDAKIYYEQELKTQWTPFRQKVLEEGIFYGAA